MTAIEALGDALELQADVGGRVRVDQLALPSPCAGWTVRDVMNHSIGVTRKFAEFACGKTNEPHAPQGDLVGPEHRVALRYCADSAQTAWASVDMTRWCWLQFGTFSATEAAGINLFDCLAHTWDIATSVGMDLDAGDELWLAGLDAAQAVIGADRDLRHYGPNVAVPIAAPPMVRFLGFLGRPAPSQL